MARWQECTLRHWGCHTPINQTKGPVERQPRREAAVAGAEGAWWRPPALPSAEVGGAHHLWPPVMVPIQVNQEFPHTCFRWRWHLASSQWESLRLKHLTCILRENRTLYRMRKLILIPHPDPKRENLRSLIRGGLLHTVEEADITEDLLHRVPIPSMFGQTLDAHLGVEPPSAWS